MFDLQCMQYLKGLEENPQNMELRNQFSQLLNQNRDKIDSFIQQFQLSPQQKQLLMEVMQESSAQNSNTQLQNNNSIQNSNNESDSSTNAFYDTTIEYFKEWRDEYFKLRSVSPKCIEIAEEYISKCLMREDLFDKNLIDSFQNLPEGENDSFKKFKNHILNILVLNINSILEKQITLVKTSSISMFVKFFLLYQLERIQLKISKKKFVLPELYELIEQSYIIREGGSH